VREEYWREIRKIPEMKEQGSVWDAGSIE
jgi:hypothetical protein